MDKYVFLCTLQSSGTWWAIDALRRHPEIGGIVHVQNLIFLKNEWSLTGGWTGNPHNESLAKSPQKTLLYSHYGGIPESFNPWKPQTNYEFMMEVVPTLSPLRDPLICMIRAWHREPVLYPHDYIMNSWIHIAKRADTLKVKFWRMTPFDSIGFNNAVKSVGLSCEDAWLNSLDPLDLINNTPGECSLRDDYKNGDIAAIEKKLPIPWRRLKDNEPIIRPFLEAHNFKNLLWWD